jgi:hypothetical protein
MSKIDQRLLYPHEPFVDSYSDMVGQGADRLRNASVAFVGLARNCALRLSQNLGLAESIGGRCKSWKLHIESNDCQDETVSVLCDFSNQHKNATFHYQVLGRQQFSSEFSGRRTIALAEYRDACQRWVRSCASEVDYVIVVDWDAWGGWTEQGLLNGIGWLVEMQGAYGMASVSLFQHDFGRGPEWLHYDLWALRGIGQPQCYWDTYRNGYGSFSLTWLQPVGSQPVLVASAFGGLCIYRIDAYLKGTYDGVHDVEHVPFHQSIAKATGQHLYLNPSQRMIMSWMETADAANSLDGV